MHESTMGVWWPDLGRFSFHAQPGFTLSDERSVRLDAHSRRSGAESRQLATSSRTRTDDLYAARPIVVLSIQQLTARQHGVGGPADGATGWLQPLIVLAA